MLSWELACSGFLGAPRAGLCVWTRLVNWLWAEPASFPYLCLCRAETAIRSTEIHMHPFSLEQTVSTWFGRLKIDQKARASNVGGAIECWRSKQVVTHCIWWGKIKPSRRKQPGCSLASLTLLVDFDCFWLCYNLDEVTARDTVGEGLLCTDWSNDRSTAVKIIIILLIHTKENHRNHLMTENTLTYMYVHIYLCT